MNYKNVVNKNEFRAIYKKNKNYFDNNNINIINNLDNFISYFKEEFKIEEHELAFIINIFLESDYFNDILKDKIPIAVNLMGRVFEEQTVLNAAYALEQALGFANQYSREG